MKIDNRIKIETAEVGSKIQILPTGVVWSVLAHEGGHTELRRPGVTKWVKGSKKVFPVIEI